MVDRGESGRGWDGLVTFVQHDVRQREATDTRYTVHTCSRIRALLSVLIRRYGCEYCVCVFARGGGSGNGGGWGDARGGDSSGVVSYLC